MTRQNDTPVPGGSAQCAFCGYPIVDDGVPGSNGTERFCSATCRDAAADGEMSFAGRHGYKYVRPGVEVLDRLLPFGVRSDSLILVRGDAGTHRRELQFELAWRAIQRGEPAVFVSYVDPPAAVVEQFLALGWNVLPALERDLLYVVDCFTRRLSDPQKYAATKNRWTEHVTRALDGAARPIRNPDDLREVENRLLSVASDLEMTNRGIVVLDSLEEVGTLVSDPQVENFLKEVRADVCQNRFVPLVAGRCSDRATQPLQQQMRVAGGGLSTDVTYFADGIVDLRLNTQLVPNTRLKQLSVRQMNGVRFVPQWLTFELGADGHVPIDPQRGTSALPEASRLRDGATPAGGNGRPAFAGDGAVPVGQSVDPGRPASPG